MFLQRALISLTWVIGVIPDLPGRPVLLRSPCYYSATELKEYGANTIDLDTDVYFEETELITPVGSPSDRTSADLDDLDWLIMEGKRPEREPAPKEEPDDTHQPDEE